MLGVSGVSGVTGILSAQNSIKLAAKNNADANSMATLGRIRELEGKRYKDQGDIIQQGLDMQAKAEEMQLKTYEHIGDALKAIDSIVVEKPQNNKIDYNKVEDDQENDQKVNEEGNTTDEDTNDGFSFIIGDDIKGSVNKEVDIPNQSTVDFSV